MQLLYDWADDSLKMLSRLISSWTGEIYKCVIPLPTAALHNLLFTETQKEMLVRETAQRSDIVLFCMHLSCCLWCLVLLWVRTLYLWSEGC